MNNLLNKIPFRVIITVPLSILIVASVALTGYVSFINGKQSVNELVNQLNIQSSERIEQHLDSYLSQPPLINKINFDGISQKQLNVNDIESLKQHFMKQILIFKDSISLGLATEQKEYISSVGNSKEFKWGYAISGKKNNYNFDIYLVINSDKEKKTASYPNYDPGIRPWYLKAKHSGKLSWTEPYLYSSGDMGIDSVMPVYNSEKKLNVVLFASITLNSISNYLKNIKTSENGNIFITNRKGLIIAASNEKISFNSNNKKENFLYAKIDGEPVMKKAVEYVENNIAPLTGISAAVPFYFELSGEKQFGRVIPYKDKYGLDWLIFTISPEKDFMKHINNGNQNTILLILFALFLAVILAAAIINFVTRPLMYLSQSTKDIAQGNLNKRVEIERADEIGELATSFNNMANQLQTSFASLQSSEEKFKRLFDISPLAIIIVDNESSKILLANKASEINFGYSLEEMVGKTGVELKIITENERIRIREKMIKYGHVTAEDSFFTTKDGERKESLTYFIPIESEKKVFSIGMLLDITKLKKTEDELRKLNDELDLRVELRTDELKKAQKKLIESEKMASLGILTAGIAHEINNPISYINASIQGMNIIVDDIIKLVNKYNEVSLENSIEKLKEIEEYKNEEDINSSLEGMKILSSNVEIGVKRVSEIIKGLNAFSRNDEGKKSLSNINENIDLTLSLLENQYKDIITITRKYGYIPEIYCYPSKLNQVFMNILSNAIDSIKGKEDMSKNEEIIITTTLENENINIIIQDTGEGINDEVKQHIFEPFYTTKEVGKGTGLGLSITMGIINIHNGKIEIESKPGYGSVFTVIIPAITNA